MYTVCCHFSPHLVHVFLDARSSGGAGRGGLCRRRLHPTKHQKSKADGREGWREKTCLFFTVAIGMSDPQQNKFGVSSPDISPFFWQDEGSLPFVNSTHPPPPPPPPCLPFNVDASVNVKPTKRTPRFEEQRGRNGAPCKESARRGQPRAAAGTDAGAVHPGRV